jgi:hypothetical protein
MPDKEYQALRQGSLHSPQGALLGTHSFFDNFPWQPAAIVDQQAAPNVTNVTECNMKMEKTPPPKSRVVVF